MTIVTIIISKINILNSKLMLIIIGYVCLSILLKIINKKQIIFKSILVFYIFLFSKLFPYLYFMLPFSLFNIEDLSKNSFINLLFIIISIFYLDVDVIIYYLLFSFALLIIHYYYLQKVLLINQLEIKEKNYLNKINNLEKKLNDLEISQAENIYFNKLEERSMIAQQLHDQLGHSLVGTIMQLEAIKIVIKQDEDKALKMLGQVISKMREGMDEIRITLKKIKPKTEYVMYHSLLAYIEEIRKSNQLEIEVNNLTVFQNLPIIYQQIFLDNIKESITNIFKHSDANRVIIGLYQYHKIIKLVIEDNGTISKDFIKGMGIKGMEERLFKKRGQLLINNDNGFRLTMILPFEGEEND